MESDAHLVWSYASCRFWFWFIHRKEIQSEVLFKLELTARIFIITIQLQNMSKHGTERSLYSRTIHYICKLQCKKFYVPIEFWANMLMCTPWKCWKDNKLWTFNAMNFDTHWHWCERKKQQQWLDDLSSNENRSKAKMYLICNITF